MVYSTDDTVHCIHAVYEMVLGMARKTSKSYFAKLCSVQNQRQFPLCISHWIQVSRHLKLYNNYNFFFKSILFMYNHGDDLSTNNYFNYYFIKFIKIIDLMIKNNKGIMMIINNNY